MTKKVDEKRIEEILRQVLNEYVVSQKHLDDFVSALMFVVNLSNNALLDFVTIFDMILTADDRIMEVKHGNK